MTKSCVARSHRRRSASDSSAPSRACALPGGPAMARYDLALTRVRFAYERAHLFAAIRAASPRRYALAAIATAALTGTLACATTGLGGALGVVVGLVAGGVTGWV